MMNLKPLTNLLHASSTHGHYNQASIDAAALRRISMTLHRWHEMECNADVVRGVLGPAGGFVHDENGKPFLVGQVDGQKGNRFYSIPDREAGALKRLAAIMKSYPLLVSYVQTDPRGAALYVVRKDDVPAGGTLDAYYSCGTAVYR